MAFKTSKIEYVIKLYNSAGTYQRVLTEVNEGITIEKSLFGGSGPLTLILNQKIDELPSDITFNAKIKIFRKDAFNSNPIQVYYGYIVSIDPIITEREELTRITCLGSISKLKNDFLRQTSNYEGSPLAYEIEPAYIDEHIKEILSHYRDLINSHYGSYSYSMIDDPDNYWSDTNYIQSTSDIGKIPYRYFNLKHLDAIREIAKFLPKNDSANDYWFWYLDDTGRFHLKKLSTTPDHILYLRKHLTSLEARKNIEGVINKVFFWNEKGSAAKQIMLIEDDSNSQDKYDIIADRITDSQIYFKDAAELYAQARLKENSEYKAEATIVVSSDKYDICSFHPGDVVSIRDVKDTNLFPSRMIIQRLILKENEAVLELSTPRPDLTTQVEQDRQFVENQLKWFGEILTRIDGTRIHTGVQHWTQEGIVFTPTSNDTVEWSEGVFYLPNDVWRVVTSNSITVSEDTILYVDEANVYCTKDTGKAAVASGTGSIKAGENFLVDSSANWETDQYKGYALWVNPSGGSAEKHIISRNTQTVLYIEAHDPFDTTDSNCSYEIHKLELRSTTKLRASGTADSGTTTTVVDSERTETNDFWNGYEIKFTSGDNAGLTRRVIDFDASADTLTLDRALPNAVSSGDKYQLYLSPENQILIADVLPDSDANNKAQIIERSSAVSDSTTAATGGKKANEALTDDYYIKRVIRSDKIEFADPECTGLNLTNTHMGYYDGTNWKVYIQGSGPEAGNFYFGGNTNNYIQWNGITLTVAGSINVTGGDAFSKTNDTLDDIFDGTTYKKTTENEKTGAGRAYNALNANNRYKQWLVNSDMVAGTNPAPGVIIDSSGIRGYNSAGQKTFEITGEEGDGLFRGDLYADDIVAGGTLTGNTIKTSDANTRVEMNSSDNALYIYYDGVKRIDLNQDRITLLDGFGIAVAAIWGDAAGLNLWASPNGNNVQIALEDTSINTGKLVPGYNQNVDLGSSTERWRTLYLSGSGTSPYGCLYLPPGGYEGRIYSGDNWCVINPRTYGIHNAVGFDNLGDTNPEGSGIWELGNDTNYWFKVHAATGGFVEHSPGGLMFEDGLKIIKRMRAKNGRLDKSSLDERLLSSPRGSKKKSDGVRISYLAMTAISAIKELAERVEALEKKLNK